MTLQMIQTYESGSAFDYPYVDLPIIASIIGGAASYVSGSPSNISGVGGPGKFCNRT